MISKATLQFDSLICVWHKQGADTYEAMDEVMGSMERPDIRKHCQQFEELDCHHQFAQLDVWTIIIEAFDLWVRPVVGGCLLIVYLIL